MCYYIPVFFLYLHYFNRLLLYFIDLLYQSCNRPITTSRFKGENEWMLLLIWLPLPLPLSVCLCVSLFIFHSLCLSHSLRLSLSVLFYFSLHLSLSHTHIHLNTHTHTLTNLFYLLSIITTTLLSAHQYY